MESMGALVKVLTLAWFGLSATAHADGTTEFYKQLAEYYAPAIVHYVGRNPKGDIPTRYDFDGDILADNNWDNLERYELKPYLYYGVIESKTHYFISYGIYHPRDFSNYIFCVPRICHENDLEGALIAVRKGFGFGKIEYVDSLAHLLIKGGSKFYTYIGDSQHQSGINQRVVLRIESGGHGVYLWDGKYPKKYELYLPSDDTSIPQIKKIPVHYDLISIQEIWGWQFAQNADRVFMNRFDFEGENFSIKNLPRSFAGKKYGRGLASPPWAWTSAGEKRGNWFLDPATWVKKRLNNPADFSVEYIYHPYLNASGLTPRP